MADEERNDPPWGKPLPPDEDDTERTAEHSTVQRPTAEQQDTVAHPDVQRAEPVHDDVDADPAGEGGADDYDGPQALPGHREIQRGVPEGEADEPDIRVTDEEVPGNITEQTRDGEQPYQWHSGLKRDHGSTDAIEFIDVKKSFGRNTILNGLNLGIPDNQISMILGPSGTGKSVCIKHMVGLLYPDQGDVLVHGESVPQMVDDQLFEMRKKFGVLFQDGALFGSMNVLDNVAYALREQGSGRPRREELMPAVSDALQRAGLWDEVGDSLDHPALRLSGGQQQRLCIARALAAQPEVLLLDEPCSALDPRSTQVIEELILRLRDEVAVVIVTHNMQQALRIADHVGFMFLGELVEYGHAEQVFGSPREPRTQDYVGGAFG